MNRKRIALVIGAGSVKCAAAIGMQNALTRAGIRIDMLVGCSAGAVYAAAMALGRSSGETADATRRLWTKEVADTRSYSALLKMFAPRLFGFNAERFGLRDDRVLLQRLRAAFGESRIEDMATPLYITATDFTNGELVVLSSGPVVDAVRASVALPFCYPPWRVDDRLLVDGYLADPMPVSVAIRQGADIILAAGFESPYQKALPSATRFVLQMSAIMSNNLLKSNFAFHSLAHHGEVIPVIPHFEQRIRLFDTEKIPYIIEAGEAAAEQQLPYLRELLANGTDTNGVQVDGSQALAR